MLLDTIILSDYKVTAKKAVRREIMSNVKDVPLTYEYVSSVLHYYPETGLIRWLIDIAKNVKAGSEAGSPKGVRFSKKLGKVVSYRYIRIDNFETPAARVAWLLTHKEWPETNVLFRDGDPSNLRINNLELAKFPRIVAEKEGRRNYKMSREAMRHYGLKRYYGLSGEQYGAMLAAQGGVCAICANPEVRLDAHGMPVALHVDHDHKTGAVRALLCYKCNSALGSMNDDPALFRKAADYLEKYSGSNLIESIQPTAQIYGFNVAFPKEPA